MKTRRGGRMGTTAGPAQGCPEITLVFSKDQMRRYYLREDVQQPCDQKHRKGYF
jgi:hypothetical protein